MVLGNALILPHRAGCVTEQSRKLVTEIAAKKGRIVLVERPKPSGERLAKRGLDTLTCTLKTKNLGQ